MARAQEIEVEESKAILEEEDEATLQAIDRGARSADEGRLIPLEEVRRRMEEWNTKSASPQKR